MPERCHFALEWDIDGPCETCGHKKAGHYPAGDDVLGYREAFCMYCPGGGLEPYGHCAYLGPVLRRCGHEEEAHQASEVEGRHPLHKEIHCSECCEDLEDACYHAFQPPEDAVS